MTGPAAERAPFDAPWQARAFTIAVHLTDTGAISWDVVKSHLIA